MGRVFGWLLLAVFAGALLAGAGYAVWQGADYYALDASLRESHPAHEALRAGGRTGVLLGLVGTALMVGMLSYSVRKRIRGLDQLGSPAWWLRFHIVCGVMGPILILLHSGLKAPHGLVAVAFWCMVLVALSGSFGRFVFGHLPRTSEGRRLDLEAAREASTALRAALVAETASARADRIGEAILLARDLDREVNSPLALIALDWEVRRRSGRVRRILAEAGLPPEVRHAAHRTLVEQLKLKRSLEAWETTRRLFAYWHLFHEPLAKAMYLIVAVHVVLAVWFGGALKVLGS